MLTIVVTSLGMREMIALFFFSSFDMCPACHSLFSFSLCVIGRLVLWLWILLNILYTLINYCTIYPVLLSLVEIRSLVQVTEYRKIMFCRKYYWDRRHVWIYFGGLDL